jgi:hypothetical protein
VSQGISAPLVPAASLAALLLSATLASTSACARDATSAPEKNGAATGLVEAKPPGPAPNSVLVEAISPTQVLVQVLEARRATADTVRISVAFTNKSAVPAEPVGGVDPSDFFLMTADRTRRVFLLRDAQNQPVVEGSLKPLQPAERRVVQFAFPAPPPAQTGRVTLRLGPVILPGFPVSQ